MTLWFLPTNASSSFPPIFLAARVSTVKVTRECRSLKCELLSMDSDEIARRVEELKLSGGTTKAVVKIFAELNKVGNDRVKRCLVGKIFSERSMNRDTIRNQLPRILNAKRNVEVEIVGDNLFLTVFTSEEDRRRALLEGPWHFFQSLMLFKAPLGLQNPSEVIFDEVEVWIQCHNLPVACMHPAYVRRIGEQLGRVLEIDIGEGGLCLGRFARVRVLRPLSRPLDKCVKIETNGVGEDILIILLYERLPDYCFTCGQIGHVAKFCEDEEADKSTLAFGPSLKAGKVLVGRPRRNSQGPLSGGPPVTIPQKSMEADSIIVDRSTPAPKPISTLTPPVVDSGTEVVPPWLLERRKMHNKKALNSYGSVNEPTMILQDPPSSVVSLSLQKLSVTPAIVDQSLPIKGSKNTWKKKARMVGNVFPLATGSTSYSGPKRYLENEEVRTIDDGKKEETNGQL